MSETYMCMFLNVQGVQQGWFYIFIFILSKVMEVRSHGSISLLFFFFFLKFTIYSWYIESQCYTLIALLAQPAPSQNKNDENPVSRREATPCTKLAWNKNFYLRKTQKTNDHRHINEYSEKHAGSSECSRGVISMRLASLPSFCCRLESCRGCTLPCCPHTAVTVLLSCPLTALAALVKLQLL